MDDQWSEYTGLYLNGTGRTALVLPLEVQPSAAPGAATESRSQAPSLSQRADMIIDLSLVDGLSGPLYCVVIGGKNPASPHPASIKKLKGTTPSDDARWEQAQEHVTIVHEAPLTLTEL